MSSESSTPGANEPPKDALRHLGSGYRRMSTPTHPTEGDYLSLKTEELVFGAIFAFMAYKLWQSLKGLRAYWKYVRAPNTPQQQIDVAVDFDEDEDDEDDDKQD